MFLHLDCRYYRGDRPCRYHRLCEGCPHYAPMGPRVLIIKLGALGDVVRTGSLLPTLAGWPDPPHVTWLTAPAAVPLVERFDPPVHRVLAFGPETLAHLPVEHFNTVICLDKDAAPCGLAMRIPAENHLGIGLSRYGTVEPLNEECDEYFTLGLDDTLKFHVNDKSHPRLIHEALGWPYQRHSYRLRPTEADRRHAARLLKQAGIPERMLLVGINPGAGHVFANKAWRKAGYIQLMRELGGRLRRWAPEAGFLMLGGADEADTIDEITAATRERANVFSVGAGLPMGTFIALVERCAVTVSADTLAMHLALATGRRSVAIFGPTAHQEIEMFDHGEKIVTPIECAPCYLRECDRSPTCQDLIPASQVIEAVERQLDAVAAEGVASSSI